MKRERKIHLPWSGDFGSSSDKGDGYTECGRRITDDTRVTEGGVDAATCESCRNLRDFGILAR